VSSSETEICNAALIWLGHSTIASLDEDSKAARIANATYEMIRDETLRNHPWNFANARVKLSATGTAPAFGPGLAYTLPADCLKVRAVNYSDPSTGAWSIEGNEILTDLGAPLEVTYTKRVTDTGLYDPSYTLQLSYNLARHWAEPLAKAATLKTAVKEDLAEILQNARTSDGQESTATLFAESSWLSGRSGW